MTTNVAIDTLPSQQWPSPTQSGPPSPLSLRQPSQPVELHLKLHELPRESEPQVLQPIQLRNPNGSAGREDRAPIEDGLPAQDGSCNRYRETSLTMFDACGVGRTTNVNGSPPQRTTHRQSSPQAKCRVPGGQEAFTLALTAVKRAGGQEAGGGATPSNQQQAHPGARAVPGQLAADAATGSFESPVRGIRMYQSRPLTASKQGNGEDMHKLSVHAQAAKYHGSQAKRNLNIRPKPELYDRDHFASLPQSKPISPLPLAAVESPRSFSHEALSPEEGQEECDDEQSKVPSSEESCPRTSTLRETELITSLTKQGSISKA